MVLDRRTGKAHPLYTDMTNLVEAVSPGDLAVIYDIPASATGGGVNVGVISDSNINLAITANYRTLFGLPTKTPTVVVDGVDPGINNDSILTTAEVELVGATAPRANVTLYTAADTDLDTGLDFAMIRAVDDNDVRAAKPRWDRTTTRWLRRCGSRLPRRAYRSSPAQETAARRSAMREPTARSRRMRPPMDSR